MPLNLESKLGASFLIFWVQVPPLLDSNTPRPLELLFLSREKVLLRVLIVQQKIGGGFC